MCVVASREPAVPAAVAAATKAATATATTADALAKVPVLGIFSPQVLRMTLVGALLGVGAHGGYYALMTWLPTYLKTERHLSVLGTGGYLAVIIVAFFCGCIAAAYLLDRIGRRGTILLFAISCVVMVLMYVFLPLSNTEMLVLGFPLGFFAAGIPASMGALFSELYPRGTRGTGVGFCYNFGRIVSAAFPVLVGHMSDQHVAYGCRHRYRRGHRVLNRRDRGADVARNARPLLERMTRWPRATIQR